MPATSPSLPASSLHIDRCLATFIIRTPPGARPHVSIPNSTLLQMSSSVPQVSQPFFSASALGYVNDCPCVIRTQAKIHSLCSCSLSRNPRTSLDFHLRMLIWLGPRAVAPADCDSPERRIVASRSWDHQNYRNHNPLAVPFFRQKATVCG